jgi:hypothetical protein
MKTNRQIYKDLGISVYKYIHTFYTKIKVGGSLHVCTYIRICA